MQQIRQHLFSHPGSALLSGLAELTWQTAQFINRHIPEGRLPHPVWAPKALMKNKERSSPPLGVPRITNSLCPKCTVETRDAILRGSQNIESLTDTPGVIQAEIVEEAGQILMRKICLSHGPFEDVLATDPKFFRRMEDFYPGRDFECTNDKALHSHGVHSIRYGRSAYVVVDITNRCNMKCSPCFMDANALGHVHEATLDEITSAIDRTLSFKPHREFNILFSGGEPTISPVFLDAVRYAKSRGIIRIHVATNGIRFAEDRQFAQDARAAGLHSVFLQFDGITEEKNRHRGVGNLAALKLQALENISAAGMRTTLQSTVIRTVNDDAVGSIVEFAVRNIDKVSGIVFQPISFVGRDEEVDDATRYRNRYTLAQLPRDLQMQLNPQWKPMRDWFPGSLFGALGSVLDVLRDPAPK